MQTCIATKEAFGRKIQRNQLIIYNSLLQFGHVLPFYAKKKTKKTVHQGPTETTILESIDISVCRSRPFQMYYLLM